MPQINRTVPLILFLNWFSKIRRLYELNSHPVPDRNPINRHGHVVFHSEGNLSMSAAIVSSFSLGTQNSTIVSMPRSHVHNNIISIAYLRFAVITIANGDATTYIVIQYVSLYFSKFIFAFITYKHKWCQVHAYPMVIAKYNALFVNITWLYRMYDKLSISLVSLHRVRVLWHKHEDAVCKEETGELAI